MSLMKKYTFDGDLTGKEVVPFMDLGDGAMLYGVKLLDLSDINFNELVNSDPNTIFFSVGFVGDSTLLTWSMSECATETYEGVAAIVKPNSFTFPVAAFVPMDVSNEDVEVSSGIYGICITTDGAPYLWTSAIIVDPGTSLITKKQLRAVSERTREVIDVSVDNLREEIRDNYPSDSKMSSAISEVKRSLEEYTTRRELSYVASGERFTCLPYKQTFRAITYGKSGFMAVGFLGRSTYSANGIKWSEMNEAPVSFYSIAYGKDQYVAIDSGSPDVYCCSGGTAWNKKSGVIWPSPGTYSRIDFIGNKFILTKEDTTNFYYSDDGLTWDMATLPSGVRLYGITYGNGKFVIVGRQLPSNEYVVVSCDETCLAWSDVVSVPDINGFHENTLQYGNGRFTVMAVPNDRADFNTVVPLYSDDGVNWIAGILTNKQPGSYIGVWHDKIYAFNKYIYLANYYELYSEDGITWTWKYLPSTPVPTLQDNTYLSLAYGNGVLVMISYTGFVWFSKDGVTWTSNGDSKSGRNFMISAKSTDGITYTGTIEGVIELTAGMTVLFIPDKTSTSTAPTLDVNGLGAITIKRRLSGTSSTIVSGNTSDWLYANKPQLLMYDGTYWIAVNQDKPMADDLYGIVSVENGGVPSCTSENEGQFLCVVNGKPTWVSLPITE